MRRVTFSLCLATALAGYAVGQWQLAESRSIAQDRLLPANVERPTPKPEESDQERQYVEKARQLFRTLTAEQQQQALGTLDQQLRQAEALAELKRVELELKQIAEKYQGTVGGGLAEQFERVLRETPPGSIPLLRVEGYTRPHQGCEPVRTLDRLAIQLNHRTACRSAQ